MKGYFISAIVLVAAVIAFIVLIGSVELTDRSYNEKVLYLLIFLGILSIALIAIRLVQTYGYLSVAIPASLVLLLILVFSRTFDAYPSLPSGTPMVIGTSMPTPVITSTSTLIFQSTETPTPLVTDIPIPVTTPEPTPNINQLLSDAVDQLAQGQIAFNPPDKMIPEETYKILVRITQNNTDEVIEELRAGLTQTGTVVQIEPIRISSEMKAELTTLKEEDMDILALSETEQPLGQKGYTEWEWRVIPLKSGIKTLFLTVSAIIRIPGEPPAVRSISVMEKEINIEVNVMYSLQTFTSNYWQWLLLSVANTVLGWLIIKRKPQTITNIQTGGGTYIGGNADTKGDFVGRDKSERAPDED